MNTTFIFSKYLKFFFNIRTNRRDFSISLRQVPNHRFATPYVLRKWDFTHFFLKKLRSIFWKKPIAKPAIHLKQTFFFKNRVKREHICASFIQFYIVSAWTQTDPSNIPSVSVKNHLTRNECKLEILAFRLGVIVINAV